MDRIEKQEKFIKIITRLIKKTCFVDIIDNGPGIPKEHLSRIFDPFFTTSIDEEGQGLGLAIVQSLINGMGGKINVMSRINEGARFAIELPVHGDADK